MDKTTQTTLDTIEEILRSYAFQVLFAVILFVLTYVKVISMVITIPLAVAWFIVIFNIYRSHRFAHYSVGKRLCLVFLCAIILGAGLSWLGRYAKSFTVEKRIDIPEVKIAWLSSLDFAPGLEVYGVKWKTDYMAYELSIKNSSETTEIDDLRMHLNIPGGFVKNEILSNEGCGDINISREEVAGGRLPPTGSLIIEKHEIYTNQVRISVLKCLPGGSFTIRFIVKVRELPPGRHGCLKVTYKYSDSDNKTIPKELTYPIILTNIVNKKIDIDSQRPVKCDPSDGLLFLYDEPIGFK